jgi:hypothetical protein
MLQNLRNHLRFRWLVFRRDLKAAFTVCQRCKSLGAYPCSICACIPLCEHCAREESIRLDMYRTTKAYLAAGGFDSRENLRR